MTFIVTESEYQQFKSDYTSSLKKCLPRCTKHGAVDAASGAGSLRNTISQIMGSVGMSLLLSNHLPQATKRHKRPLPWPSMIIYTQGISCVKGQLVWRKGPYLKYTEFCSRGLLASEPVAAARTDPFLSTPALPSPVQRHRKNRSPVHH